MFAVDGGSTQSIAQTIQKQGLRKKGWVGGGYDLTPNTEKLMADGQIDFTIDQQPYLQGFLPILQLYMYNASTGLSGIADTDTGLKFLDKTTCSRIARRRVATRAPAQARRPQVGLAKQAHLCNRLASNAWGRLAIRFGPHTTSPATSRARGGAAGRVLRRFLTLREGSIIVVTVITIMYFAAITDHF